MHGVRNLGRTGSARLRATRRKNGGLDPVQEAAIRQALSSEPVSQGPVLVGWETPSDGVVQSAVHGIMDASTIFFLNGDPMGNPYEHTMFDEEVCPCGGPPCQVSGVGCYAKTMREVILDGMRWTRMRSQVEILRRREAEMAAIEGIAISGIDVTGHPAAEALAGEINACLDAVENDILEKLYDGTSAPVQ